MAPPTVDEVKKMTVKDLKTELEKLGYVMSRTCNPTVLAVLEYAQWHNGLRANEDTGNITLAEGNDCGWGHSERLHGDEMHRMCVVWQL